MGNVDRTSISHRVFLIRHGETVDNVAGLYAGSRDSDLTVHGVQQAKKLAQHFRDKGIVLTHIFASNLSRAVKTACAIRDTQEHTPNLQVAQCEDLREQDFGSYEGRSWQARENVREESRRRNTEFRDMESKESMTLRANRFLEVHLARILSAPTPSAVAIVSHGMLLGSLWRCILHRQPANSIELDAGAMSDSASPSLERIGSWSNTGYLHLEFSLVPPRKSAGRMRKSSDLLDNQPSTDAHAAGTRQREGLAGNYQPMAQEFDVRLQFKIRVLKVNSRTHLQGLKRARGGLGSSRFDEKQKSIGDFFSKTRP